MKPDRDSELKKESGIRFFQQPPWLLLGLTLLALGLRLFRIDLRSIWLDEAYSLRLAAASWRGIVQGAAMDIHPPLFHFLLGGWIRIWGSSEFALRSLSAFAGALLVPMSFALATALRDRRTGWWCAGLVTVSPYFLELSRSGRMASWLALLSMLSVYYFWRLLQRDTWANRLGYWLATAACLYTHYFGFLILIAQHFHRFVHLRQMRFSRATRRRWMLLQLGLLAVYLPWLGTLLDHLDKGGPSWRGVGAPWWEPGHALYAFLFGTTLWSTWNKAGALALLGLAMAAAFWGWKQRPRLSETGQEKNTGPGMALILFVVPMGLVWMYSQQRLNVFDHRYLSGSAWALLFLMAMLLARLPRWSTWVSGGLLLAAFSIPIGNHYFVPRYYDDWRQVSRYLIQHIQPEDVVAVYPAWNETPLNYYFHNRVRVQGLPGAYDPISGVTQDYFPMDAEHVQQVQKVLVAPRRVWLVLVNEGESQAILVDWCRTHYKTGPAVQSGGVRILAFDTQGQP